MDPEFQSGNKGKHNVNKVATQAMLSAAHGIRQKVVFGNEAHSKLLEGASVLAQAVGSTMGPSGHNVIIDGTVGAPIITKDGVTVARSINLKDRLPSMGAELLKEVASKTNELAGDGTTTATVLAHAMLKEGIKMVSSGRDAIYVKKGMDLATEKVTEQLKKNCQPVRDNQDIVNIGTISANGDSSIGDLLSEAIGKVGQDGIITIEPGRSTKTVLEVVEGMQLDSGYLSPYFVTNSEKNTVELENPLILLTSRKISSLGEFIPLLEKVATNNSTLLVIADDVEGEALHTLIVNKLKDTLACCAIKAPSYGENRTDILQDIAAMVGANVLDASSSTALKNLGLDDLGQASKVIVTRTSTTIVGLPDEDRKNAVAERVQTLKTALASDGTLDALHIDRFRKRLAKLSGGIAVVKVGGSTEVEILEKKDRVEDALNATLAAAQEGIVPGGGCALFYAQQAVWNELKNSGANLSEDEWAGVQVILNACKAPLQTIVSNTGKSPDVVMDKLSNKSDLRFGYNAAKGTYGNLVDEGIIDPVKVTRYALEHASSVVGLMLTCNSVVLNESEPNFQGHGQESGE